MLRKASVIGVLATILVLSSLTAYAATPHQADSSFSPLALTGYSEYIDYPGDPDTYYILSSVVKTRTAQTARNVVSTVSGTSYKVCWILFSDGVNVSNDSFHRTGD